jgi:hypothetical protein
VYEELRGSNFELVAVAQDTGGEAAAGPFYDAAKATYTTLVDPRHTVSALFNLVNVPTAVMIDEEGRIARLDEGAYTRTYRAGNLTYGTDAYVPALRDWVAKGNASAVAKPPGEIAAALPRRSREQDLADAHFRLGVHFQLAGDEERANRYWAEAQRLHPESWNYHRQDWSFTPEEAGPNWLRKVQTLGDKPYYAPMDLPEPEPGPEAAEPPR